jgi:histidinol-phosphatase (PHP family)
MIKACFHLHTSFSDGSGSVEDFVTEASRQGFTHLGFSDHAPVPFDNPWSLKSAVADAYVEIIEPFRHSNALKVYRALEADFIPGITLPFNTLRRQFKLDYIIGSVHLVKPDSTGKLWFIDGSDETEYFNGIRDLFDGDVKAAVSAFYRQQMMMIDQEKPDILGHFDKIVMHNKGRLFSGKEPWIRVLQDELLEVVRKSGVAVEINTRGLYKGRHTSIYPSIPLVLQCASEKIPLILSSDAHKPEEISCFFPETLAGIKKAGILELSVFEEGKFHAVPIGRFLS